MSIEIKYVVQYRREGDKKWIDSHIEAFPLRPSKALINDK